MRTASIGADRSWITELSYTVLPLNPFRHDFAMTECENKAYNTLLKNSNTLKRSLAFSVPRWVKAKDESPLRWWSSAYYITLERCYPWPHVAISPYVPSLSQLLSSCCYLFTVLNSSLLFYTNRVSNTPTMSSQPRPLPSPTASPTRLASPTHS